MEPEDQNYAAMNQGLDDFVNTVCFHMWARIGNNAAP